MTEHSAERPSTQVSTLIKAARTDIHKACLDPDALASWRVPDNMKGHVHAFDAREGGTFRMSLTYKDPEQSPGGKTSAGTDTLRSAARTYQQEFGPKTIKWAQNKPYRN